MSKSDKFLELPETLRNAIDKSHVFPILLKTIKRGQKETKHMWSITVTKNDNGTAVIKTSHGDVNGKQTESTKVVTVGKHIGKKNETTPYEQAIKDAKSTFTSKYFEHEEIANEYAEQYSIDYIIPKKFDCSAMLAEKYEPKKTSLSFPVAVSAKLDGLRCLVKYGNWTMEQNNEFTGKIRMYTREMNVITIYTEIEEELLALYKKFNFPENYVLDGELYSKGVTFEEISGVTRTALANKNEVSKELINKINFNVFDICIYGEDIIFKNRYDIFKKISGFDHIKVVQCIEISSTEEVEKYVNGFINEGFEGLIIRDLNGLYESKRTKALYKYKKNDSEEVFIDDITSNVKVDKQTLVIKCRDVNNISFNVNGNGTDEYRLSVLNDKNSYIGKKIRISFNGRTTKNNAPKFAKPILTNEGKYVIL